eukprot:COSAG04_NODE_25028_length_313_cov_0.714953_1_plen_23_part_10
METLDDSYTGVTGAVTQFRTPKP